MGMFDSLNPSNWSINGNSIGSLGKKAVDTATAPVRGALAGDPLYNRLTSGKWDFNPDSMVNKATNKASSLDSIHRTVGISDSTFGKVQRIGLGAAGLVAGGEAAYGAFGGGSAAPAVGGGAPLPAGGMVGTGGTSAADASLGGVGAGTGGAGTGGVVAGSGETAAATAGMTTAQKIALGLVGANSLLGKKQGLNPTLMAGATPAQNTSNKILDQYNSGQLNPADQYNIAKWAQDAKASKQQYYAQAGLSDSSMATQDIASIDAQASAMRDQALQNMLQGGLAAAGIANTATGQAVQLQMQQDQQAQQAQQNFFEMLAFSVA